MGEKATTIDEQIDKLESRGLIIEDKEKAKELLLDIGYYRLGFYSYFFQDQDNNFLKDTKFKDIRLLYYLNIDLKNLLIKYLNRIEINFRTKIIYYVSNKYKDNPTWFIHGNIMNKEYMINFKEKVYTKEFIRTNKMIFKHHKKYPNDKFAPAWKTFEYMTFGAVIKAYQSLKDKTLKEFIASEYGLKNIKVFQNLLDTLRFLRNTCAHGGVLCDLRTPKGIKKITGKLEFHNDDRYSLNTCFSVMLFMLNSISKNRAQDFQNEVKSLFLEFKDHPQISNIIENNIRYRYI